MIRNYLKIGFRNLVKNKLFSAINVTGMAISMACFLIITLFVLDELKYDQHIVDAERKFRVFTTGYSDNGDTRNVAMVPPMFGPTLKEEYPEVESTSRLLYIPSNVLFEVGEKKLTEPDGYYAEPSVFDLLSIKLLSGNPKTVLKEPRSMLLSKSLATKYFDNKDPVGEMIQLDNESYKIEGVYEDQPPHSHIRLNYLIAFETLTAEIPAARMHSWGWQQFFTYIKLKEGSDYKAFDDKLLDFAKRNAWPEIKDRGFYYIPHLLPVRDIHLHASDHQFDVAVRGTAATVYILAATAVFILIISVLNFVNLSTARALNRVKEVGVRKVVGAVKTQLIYQFVSESVMVAFIALIIAGLMSELAIPLLNNFTSKNIPLDIFLNPLVVLTLLVFAVFLGVAAGAYPAFYISSYMPAHILGNKKSGKSGKVVLRQALVVLQFILSFFLITASFVVSEQNDYIRNKDLGFNKENIVVLPLRGEMSTNFASTKTEFTNHANVISATLGYGLPGDRYAGDGIKDDVTKKDWPVTLLTVDHDYPKTLGLKIIAGRDFSTDFPSDEFEAFIINETAAKMLGHANPAEALNHPLSWNRWDDQTKMKVGKVIGVVKDFHVNSLKETVTPVVIQVYPFAYSSISLRIKGDDIPATIAHFEKTWKKFNSEWPFEYKFLDENFDKMYKSEEKLGTLFTFFTGFTIFIACLGLFGLVVYSTTQKYREISIRKVLGAEVSSLIVLLTTKYFVLIAIAFVVAIPFSYYAANKWLEEFVYKIDVSPMLFVKAGLFILIVTVITVGVQSFNAARSNPVNALKEQ
jgi:putative ABC transport system permease protein